MTDKSQSWRSVLVFVFLASTFYTSDIAIRPDITVPVDWAQNTNLLTYTTDRAKSAIV